jgi:undecaprenyl-diphosphatase
MKQKLYLPAGILLLVTLAPLWLPYIGVYDQYILERVIALRTPFLDTFFETITYLGDTTLVGIVLIAALIFLYKKGKYHDAKIILASSIIGLGVNLILKDFVARSRPYSGFSLISESSYSYPSAHATIAVTLYFLLLWYIAKIVHKKYLRPVFHVCAIIPPTLLVFSRVYLGVHFPTDIIAGALLGTISILFCTASFRKI